MSAEDLSRQFLWDLKLFKENAAGRVPESAMPDVMRAVAPVIGRVAAEQGRPADVLFLDRGKLRDDGWLVWGQAGDAQLWHESRGVGPHAWNIAFGMALARGAGELREFAVPPPITGHPIEIETSWGDFATGEDWPLGSMDELRVPQAGIRIPVLYSALLRFAELVDFRA